MLITRNGEIPGGDLPPAPPSDGPRLTLGLVDGRFLDVKVEWAAGRDIEAFATLLVLLCQGKLVVPIANAVAVHAARIGEKDKGDAIHELLAATMVASRQSGDEPVICPTQAVKLAMKSFQG